jgi:hypothetical protein
LIFAIPIRSLRTKWSQMQNKWPSLPNGPKCFGTLTLPFALERQVRTVAAKRSGPSVELVGGLSPPDRAKRCPMGVIRRFNFR